MNPKKFLILLSLFSLFFYPINALVTVFLSVGAVICALFVLKDKDTAKKSLQATLAIAPIYILQAIFSAIINIASKIVQYKDNYYSSDFYKFITDLSSGLSIFYYGLFLVVIVTAVVCYFKQCDMPIAGKFAEKIIGKSEPVNTENTEDSENN